MQVAFTKAANTIGVAAASAEQGKFSRYLGKNRTEFSVAPYVFQPLVWEIYGFRTKETADYLQHMYRQVSRRTGRSYSNVSHFWETRFSVALWKGNVAVIHRSQSYLPGAPAADTPTVANNTYAYND